MAKSVATADIVFVHGTMDSAKRIAILTIIILDMWSVTRDGAGVGQKKNQRSRSMNVVYVYEFEDGTRIEMWDIGLSTQELWALKDIHGDCKCSLRYER